jgi:sirohydrochlorin cobaltochelatase
VGLAHGSRHADGTRSIESLMDAVAASGDVDARPAFLDLADPDLVTVVRRLAAAGHTQAVVVPLLFTVAFHATVDVPEAVREAAVETGVELVVSEILGTGADVEELVRTSMVGAGVPAEDDVLLYAVGSSNAAANDAVHALASRLGRHRPGRVRAAFGTADPRAATVLTELGAPVALVPLFLSPGLLLAPLARIAEERGWTLAPPLGDLAAPLVLSRYVRARQGAGLR